MSDGYPILVADIGGTHARFGIVRSKGEVPRELRIIPGKDHDSLRSALEAYLSSLSGEPPRRGCIAVAGPVEPGQFILTNRPQWNTPLSDLKSAFGLDVLDVVNDFEALAAALPLLLPGELEPIGEPSAIGTGSLAVVGPGTGLGVGAAIRTASGWRALPGEGGHVELASPDPRASAAIAAAAKRFGRVSAERFLAGPGIELLHVTLGEVDGAPREPQDAAAIATCAGGGEAAALDTVAVFFRLLASFAGDVALMFGARGGVFLSGGVAARLKPHIDARAFRRDFENKGRLRPYLAAIPVNLIVTDTLALRGCAVHLADEQALP